MGFHHVRKVNANGAAVDVSSGVESTRGHKDPERFVTFVRAARS